MQKVMFLCTGNSCRSQMAEGFARHYGADLLEVHSAGLTPAGVNENAIQVMAEIGIDISRQRSKVIDQELLDEMDIIITLCGHAEALCPRTPPHIKRLHWPVKDPILTRGSKDKVLADFRRARDEIMDLVLGFIKELRQG
ncbi:MAG: arsenate reductase ArsC [Nitrospirota bacterium]